MKNENWIVKIVDAGYKTQRDVFIFRERFDGKGEMMRAGGETEIFDLGEAQKPTLELSPECLQELANVLGNSGFKPKQGFLEGKIEATEKHLEDMRNLVFKNSKP